MDVEGMMLEANAAFQALSGYAENQLIAMKFHDIVHPDEAHRVMDILERLTKGSESQAKLVELKQHQQGSIEMERLRLAQNLHDTPLQELYAVIYRLEELRLGADPD